MRHLALSSTTNSKDPEFPRQDQPHRGQSPTLTGKVAIRRLKSVCDLYIRTDVNLGCYIYYLKNISENFHIKCLQKLFLR